MTRYPFLMNTITSSIHNKKFVSISPLLLLKLCNCHVVYPSQPGGRHAVCSLQLFEFQPQCPAPHAWMNEWAERKMPTLMPILFSTPGNLGPALLLLPNQREANSDKRSLQPPGIFPPPAWGAEKKQSNATHKGPCHRLSFFSALMWKNATLQGCAHRPYAVRQLVALLPPPLLFSLCLPKGSKRSPGWEGPNSHQVLDEFSGRHVVCFFLFSRFGIAFRVSDIGCRGGGVSFLFSGFLFFLQQIE